MVVVMVMIMVIVMVMVMDMVMAMAMVNGHGHVELYVSPDLGTLTLLLNRRIKWCRGPRTQDTRSPS